MAGSFLASMGRLIWRVAEAHALSAPEMFANAGLDPDMIDIPRARYPFDRVCQVWQDMAEAVQDQNLGLTAAAFYRFSDLHALGVAFLCSRDLAEAFNRVDRYETVLNSDIDVVLEHHGDEFRIYFDGLELNPEQNRIIEDLRIAVLVALTRDALHKDTAPRRVEFTHPKPIHDGRHAELLNCPVVFSAARSCLVFDDATVEQAFPGRNWDLARANDLVLDAMMSQLGEDHFVDRVRSAIVEALPSGAPGVSQVARALAVSTRTLHRRLAEQGYNYRDLLNSVRKELALSYLAEKHMPITEVSFLVGYADISSFSRAFKRWTGQSPRDFAKNLA